MSIGSILGEIAGNAIGSALGLPGKINKTQASAAFQSQETPQKDWRVRLALAPNSNYLYNDPATKADASSILYPLSQTNGVLFPYTPSVQVTYAADYSSSEPTHSNYTIYQYKRSSVDQIQISCDFTAQDTFEANYMLAVIHFFRSATKMFYGQDENPRLGSPPPLCFLYGLGTFQFDNHPLAITSFNYVLPTDVDYIRAGIQGVPSQMSTAGQTNTKDAPTNALQEFGGALRRLATIADRILPGGNPAPPVFSPPTAGTGVGTYVPTKIQIQITAIPIVSRNNISNNFSLKDYANGSLLKGSSNKSGGIW